MIALGYVVFNYTVSTAGLYNRIKHIQSETET
jgi:hypothetical protein